MYKRSTLYNYGTISLRLFDMNIDFYKIISYYFNSFNIN